MSIDPIHERRRLAVDSCRAGLVACAVALLAARAHADTIVQEGGLSGPGGPVNEHVIELDRFDTLGGTRVLNFVKLEFSTMLFAESVTNGAGGMVHATAALWADYAFADGTPIAETSTSLDVMVDNTGKPVATLYLDADEAIEDAAQRRISEIFEQFGEAYFRDGERRVIARLMEENSGVIATGGGAFVDPDTRALILEKGIAVWIDCDIDTLVERTSRRGHRPLLKSGDPLEILTGLLNERGPLYAEAPVRVKSNEGPHAETAHAILRAIEDYLQ